MKRGGMVKRGKTRARGPALGAVLLVLSAVYVVLVVAPGDRAATADEGPGTTGAGRVAFAGTGHVSLGGVDAPNLGQGAQSTPFFGAGPVHQDTEGSARGGVLVFTSLRDEARPQVYLRSADGVVHRLTTGLDAGHPVLSPDGKTVAFASAENGRHSLYLVGADGNGLRKLNTGASADEQWPSWSPDGARLAFSSNRVAGRQIYALTLASGEVARITDEPSGDAIEPSWNPVHDTAIAYVVDTDRNDSTTDDEKAHVIGIDGTGDRLLVGGGHDDWMSYQPSWKPDGESVLFVSRNCLCGSATFNQVYAQPAPAAVPAGGPQLLLAEDRLVTDPTWLSGPDRLVVTRLSAPDRVSVDLRDIRPDGSDPRDLGICVLREDPDAGTDPRKLFQPSPGSDPWLERQTYSPDGRRIAFTRFENAADGTRIERVWLADADGGNAQPMPLADRGPHDWEFDPVWSPDGREIALSRRSPGGVPPGAGGASRIVVAEAATGRVVHLLTPPAGAENENDTQPAFSADGRTLAFTRGSITEPPTGEVRRGRIWTVDTASFTRQRDLSAVVCGSDCPVADDSAVFSPDGTTLVFNRESDGLLQVRADGSDCRVLMRPDASCAGPVGPPAAAPFQPRDAAFSPDGKELVLSARSQVDAAAPEHLQILDLTSGDLTPLTDGMAGRQKEPSWQSSVDLRTVPAGTPPPAVVGTPARVTLTVTDDGPAPSPGTTVVFAPPSGLRVTGASTPLGTCRAAELRCDLGVLEPGKPVQLTVDVVGDTPGVRTLSWSVTGPVLDSDPGNNSASTRVSTVDAPPPPTTTPPPPPAPPLPGPNLRVSVSPDPSYVGGQAIATYLVANSGGQPATGIRVALVLPAGVPVVSLPPECPGGQCSVGDLAPGGTAVLQVVFVPNAAVDTQVVGVLTTTGPDADPGDNTANARLHVLQPKIVAMPPIGPPGFVTSVRGTDFPPGQPVVLSWSPGITAAAAPTLPRPDGTFAAQLLILPKDQLGPRTITATGSGFSAVTTPFMVIAPSVGPPDFVERR